ncbi:MAG TPA: HYR domain-containing protein [Vicinamibacterales bacterium]
MGWRGLCLAAVTLLCVALPPFHEHANAQGTSAPAVVISEYRLRGPNGVNDEFIELFNAGVADVDVSGWALRSSTATGVITALTTLPAATRIRRGCFYLIANTVSANSVGVTPDRAYMNANGTPDGGGLALLTNTSVTVDQVGNSATSAFGEGTRLPAFPSTAVSQSYERHASSVSGFVDTNDNAADFSLIAPSTPRNSNVANCLTPVNLTVSGTSVPTSVEQGQRVQLFAAVTPATLPGSTNVQVFGNLSAIGGAVNVQFADNGVAPDAVANDNVFSYEHLVPQGNPLGERSITLNATDQQARRGTNTFSVTVTLPASLYTPHQIQGAGAATPLAIGEPVMVRGVVTAKKANGFFLQTEPGAEDADPNTSEGLFVPATANELTRATVGHLVYVKGVVAELVPLSDQASPSITAVGDLSFIFDLGASTLPAPVELTEAEVSADGALDQLERFEGMRVHAASLTAVNGTGADGAFYAVLTGQARPFREEGVESGYPVLTCAGGPCNVPVFDGNPERLRVDSDGQSGVAAVHVSTGAVMEATGPLDFELRTFTIVPDAPLTVTGGMSVLAVPAPAADQFTVASFFLGGSANVDRLAKASNAVRNGLHTPDIVGVQQVEDLAALTALAQAIDADAAAAGQAPPNYAALFLDGSDAGVGLLVKPARVAVNAFEAAGSDAVMVRALVSGPSTMMPQAITVIVPRLLSKDGSETGDESGTLVREQRKAQAEALASFIQARQSSDPNEAIVSIGDYNAFAFNDGYVDVVGTVAGNPAAGDRVATATLDLVSPDLVNLGELMPPAERYSSVSNGNAQALDHALATANLSSRFAGAARARINADFPAVLSGDAASPSGLSDRDPMVLYFTFAADEVAPAFENVPADQTVEATAPDGAAVTYTPPTATDNLDASVAVTCDPQSGSVFPLGSSGVTCSAQDEAGNGVTAAFTVTVVDTTAPVLTAPEAIVAEAQSSNGAAVVFAASATDAVTPSPAVTCTVASGSVFPLGSTLVQCSAQDAAGNGASASFVVTVVDTTAPTLTLPGNITAEAASSEGRAVSFVATAIDAVSGSPAVDCTPASGSTFAVGETVVTCAAADAAGNVATGTFTVTITSLAAPPLFGHMAGVGAVLEGDKRVWFAFDVKETANAERGWVMVQVRPAPGRPDRYLSAAVSGVQMSDSPDYTPARSKTGVDTVVFSGVGYWNGASGYRYEITAADRGEPGRGRDMFSLKIYSPSGELVESAGGVIRDGNIRSLR